MDPKDTYRAMAPPPSALCSGKLQGAFQQATSKTASSPSPSSSQQQQQYGKTMTIHNSTQNVPTGSLEKYLGHSVQPFHMLLVGAKPDLLFTRVGAALRAMPLTIIKENDFKRKFTCTMEDMRFKVKLSTVSGSKTVVLEIIVLSPETGKMQNCWGELLEKLANSPGIKPHVAGFVKAAKRAPPLFTPAVKF